MQSGVRSWVLRTAREGRRSLREFSPPALSSLLCAAAFCPLIAAGAGIAGAGTSVVAGIGMVSSVGGGILSGVIASALDRLRANNPPPNAGSLDHVLGSRHELIALNVRAPTRWWFLRPFDSREDVQHVQGMGGWISRLITDTAGGRLGGDGVP